MRADVYLHHVRIFKTRSLSAQACTKGNVRIAGQPVKPARDLKVNDLVGVERGDLSMLIRVVAFPEHRVGAPLVAQFMEDLTPKENYERAAAIRRERALIEPPPSARPDKKQMRAIRQLFGRE